MCLSWKCVSILHFFCFTSTWLFFQVLNNKRQSNPDQVTPESSWATKISLSLEKPLFSPFESIIVLSCPFLELSPFRTLLATLGFKIQLCNHLRILSILKCTHKHYLMFESEDEGVVIAFCISLLPNAAGSERELEH